MKKLLFLIFALLALSITTQAFTFVTDWSEAAATEQMATMDVVDATPMANTTTANIPAGHDLADFFTMFGALLPLVVSITAFLVSRFTLNATGKQLMAWSVSIGLSFAGWWLQIGYLTDVTWWMALIHGAALGLAANGFFDINIIKAIINAIFPPKPAK